MSRRLTALVIGNGAYENAGELKNSANDAEDIAAKLESCGFSVIKELDLGNERFLFPDGWTDRKRWL